MISVARRRTAKDRSASLIVATFVSVPSASLAASSHSCLMAEGMDRTLAVHRELAAVGQHRNFRLPDLIIAAAAELSGSTVLHYDADYDRIGAVTGQRTEWIAPQGSL